MIANSGWREHLTESTQRQSKPADRFPMERLNDSLDKVDYRGKFTESAAGIERAVYELKTGGRTGARKSIIFLTDDRGAHP
jgi:hypothetical protein